jgi:hypothetical protein
VQLSPLTLSYQLAGHGPMEIDAAVMRSDLIDGWSPEDLQSK